MHMKRKMKDEEDEEQAGHPPLWHDGEGSDGGGKEA